MLQPVDTIEYGIALGQRRLERAGVTRQFASLLGDAGLQSAVARGEFEQLGVHSGGLR